MKKRDSKTQKIFKFVIVFVISCILLQIILHIPIIVEPFMYITAKVTYWIVGLLGSSVSLNGFHIIGDIDMEIIYECTGVYGMIILLSGFIAAWFPWEEKIKASLWGIAVVFAINQIRLVSIFMISSRWPNTFEILHTYFWQLFLIVFVCMIYYKWFKEMNDKYPKNEK